MSGGHYDYKTFQVKEFADMIETQNDQRRIAFKELMSKVAEACHAIEWEDSGDTGKEDTDEAIDEVFSFLKADPTVIAKAASFDVFKETVKGLLKLTAPTYP